MLNKIKIAISFILCVFLFCMVVTTCRLSDDRDRWASEAKAYESEADEMASQLVAHEMTARQLAASRDSLTARIDSLRRELGVRKRRLEAAYVRTETLTRTDTITLTDTIFVGAAMVDTTLRDPWYTLDMQLVFPNVVVVSPSFRNELGVIVSRRRETVEPPRRFFLFRLFQRKHDVIVVDVTDSSPYCETTKQRFVKIID